MTSMEELNQLDEFARAAGPIAKMLHGPRVVGIDPSLVATGYAHPDGSTEVIGYPRNVTGDMRLWHLFQAVQELVYVDGPTHVVMENAPGNTRGSGDLGMVQGVVRAALLSRGVPYITVVFSTLKLVATGNGRATKSDMRAELLKRSLKEFGEEGMIDLPDDNRADAWWLRELGLQLLGAGTIPLPQNHTRTLKNLNLKGWR